jgi:cell wall-associated NlpC family hydrolase
MMEFVGKPYDLGAQGPDAFDCWSLIAAVYKQELNLEIPIYQASTPAGVARAFKRHLATAPAVQVYEPIQYDIAVQYTGACAAHCGVLIGPLTIMHASAERGQVVTERLSKFILRAPTEYYRWQ